MKNLANFFIVTIAAVLTLIYGKNLLIPFVFALLLWFIVKEITNVLNRVAFIRKSFPMWLKHVFTSLIIFSILGFISTILSNSIQHLAKSYNKYQNNIDSLIAEVKTKLNIDLVKVVKDHAGDLDFGQILSSVFNSLTDILGNTFMILIYVLFIFLEQSNFKPKLQKVFTGDQQMAKISEILNNIENSIAKYLGLKTFVSLITGVLSYITLLIIGIDSPVFWAFLIFLLNFIPTIGSLIGTLFPAIFCLLQYGEFTPALLVLGIVGAIQVLVGNIIEPKLMGNSMNVSSLATIIALSFWGAIWGITGMILSIPITVILLIIFSQFPATRSVAIMLSEHGDIKNSN